ARHRARARGLLGLVLLHLVAKLRILNVSGRLVRTRGGVQIRVGGSRVVNALRVDVRLRRGRSVADVRTSLSLLRALCASLKPYLVSAIHQLRTSELRVIAGRIRGSSCIGCPLYASLLLHRLPTQRGRVHAFSGE